MNNSCVKLGKDQEVQSLGVTIQKGGLMPVLSQTRKRTLLLKFYNKGA